jgi:beta-galactosidase
LFRSFFKDNIIIQFSNTLNMIKYSRFLIVLLAISFSSITAQESIQRKQLFDYNWKFFLGDVSEAKASNFEDKSWRVLDLPHDWSIEGKLDENNPAKSAGGYFPTGIGWYRKSFTMPSEWKGKQVSIYFEGVYMNSEVFINGKSLGVYPYGYSSFKYDLTPYLEPNKENVISVRVDNSKQQNCRWYSGSGIYRHVWMIVTDSIHIAHQGVGITTSDIAQEQAKVSVKIKVKNETNFPQEINIKSQLFDNKGKKAGTAQTSINLLANSEKEIEQIVSVSKPKLWTLESPHLYNAAIQVLNGNKVIDETQNTFGIRTIKFSVENGFQLNEKTIKLNGGCVHHDNGILGASAYDRAEERKAELLKSAGFNAVRTSHNIPSEVFLETCDRLGLLVIDEAFDGWRESKTPHDYSTLIDKWWQRDLDAMILRDRNHPSIIMWSIGNEIIERKKPEAVETAKMMVDYAHKLDATRPVTSAMASWDSDWEIFDPLFAVQDLGGYNYLLHHAIEDHKRVPSRIILQTESYPRDAFANWKLVENNTYIIGDFVWTALDYLGESGIGRWFYTGDKPGEHYQAELFPWHGAYCGDIDLLGWRKPISHYRSMLYNNNEKLYLAVRQPNKENQEIKETLWSVWPTWENWNWPGHEGKDIEVEVYSKYPKVRLYLNDKLLGEKETTVEQEFKANFKIPYTAGTLKAVGVLDNAEVENRILKTSGNPAKINLKADHTVLKANGQDLSYITVEINDKEGNLVANADNKLQFEIEGNASIAGIGNANLKDIDQYSGKTCNAWNGRAQIIIKSSHKTGVLKLKVSSSGLPDSFVTLQIVK